MNLAERAEYFDRKSYFWGMLATQVEISVIQTPVGLKVLKAIIEVFFSCL